MSIRILQLQSLRRGYLAAGQIQHAATCTRLIREAAADAYPDADEESAGLDNDTYDGSAGSAAALDEEYAW
jgi:hypothetical protein